MKHTKKLAGMLLALVMVLSMSVTAFAAQSSNNTITINNAKVGETYSAYKMLELFVDNTSEPTAYTYTVAPEWEDFFDDANSAVWGTVLVKDVQGYFTAIEDVSSETEWSTGSDLSAFAEAAAKYVRDNRLTTDITSTPESGTTATLNTTESGYYLITSTLGTRAMIDTTPGDVEINEKNSEDTIEKTVKEGAEYGAENDAQVGDTVEFQSVATIVPRSINVKIHDTMDDGLTLNIESVKVYTDAEHTELYGEAEIKTGNEADTNDTFTIVIPDAFAATASADQKLYVVYTAEINSAAVVKNEAGVNIVDQNNKTHVSFGDNTSSTESTTKTTTHKFTVHKYATGKDTENLAGAIFQVKKNNTIVNLVKLDDTNYRVVDDTETSDPVSHVAENNEVATIEANAVVSDFVTVASGDIVIWGVDSGDYTIEEIQAPKGYNMINPASKSVTVDSANSTTVNVENATGTELPSTGGIGTTIFYVLGSILVLGAAVLLIAKKRMNAAK